MSSTSSTLRSNILGLWAPSTTIAPASTSAAERDLEAQTIRGSWEHVPPAISAPAPTRTHSPHQSIDEPATDAIDAFFGVTRPRMSGTRDSRHDDARSSTEALPSYEHATATAPPVYSSTADTPTLAMYLFKFGFLFPLFWIAGAFILLSPLRAPEDWETSKPEMERREIIESMRRTEVKWARRCLVASLILVLGALAIGLTAFFVMRS